MKTCGECGDEVDTLYTYCESCYDEVVVGGREPDPVSTTDDGTILVDDVPVAWNI